MVRESVAGADSSIPQRRAAARKRSEDGARSGGIDLSGGGLPRPALDQITSLRIPKHPGKTGSPVKDGKKDSAAGVL